MSMPNFDDFEIDGIDAEEFDGGMAFKVGMRPKKNSEIVVKTIPAKKDWIKKFDELHDMAAEVTGKANRMKALRKALWAQIELETEIYDHMHYNDETKEVEIMKDKNDPGKGRPIKSPIQSL